MTAPRVSDCLAAVAYAMASDQDRFTAVLATWLEREGLILSKRDYRRMWQRAYVRNGADYRWSRLLTEARQADMQRYLEWAQSKRSWSQK